MIKSLNKIIKHILPSIEDENDCNRFFTPFGLFLIIGFTAFWVLNIFFIDANGYESDFLRLSIVAIGFILVLKDYWPSRYKKYSPFLWYFTLIYTLPFFFTFMWLHNPTDLTRGTVGIIFSITILSLFVDRWKYILFSALGISLAFIASYTHLPTFEWPQNYSEIGFALIEVSICLLIFGSRKDQINKEKFDSIKIFALSIAHEIRAPIVNINLSSEYLNQAITRQLITAIESKDNQLILDTLQSLKRNTTNVHRVVETMLGSIQEFKKDELEEISILDCINQLPSHYGLRKDELHWLKINPSENFIFLGKKNLFMHVLSNLLKNSLAMIRAEEKGEITIWTKTSKTENTLYFRDTAKGISQKDLPLIFNGFYSRREGGTGIGLAFSKQIMQKFSADITCQSEEGQHATFIIKFPKSNTPYNLNPK